METVNSTETGNQPTQTGKNPYKEVCRQIYQAYLDNPDMYKSLIGFSIIEKLKELGVEGLPYRQSANLAHFLSHYLSYEQFINLHLMFGISQKKLTRLLSGTDEFTADHVQALSDYLLISPSDLISHFRLINNITLSQMDELTAWWNSLKGGEL